MCIRDSYDKAVRCLYGGHFYMVGLDVAPFEVDYLTVRRDVPMFFGRMLTKELLQ